MTANSFRKKTKTINRMPADPEVGDLSSLLLTQADLLSFHSPAQLSNLAPEILAKLAAAAQALKAPYIIDKTKYDHVFITSDIHCDLVKLDAMLTKANIVTKRPQISLNNVVAEEFNKAPAHVPEVISKIYNTSWLPERTLLIIVGDIVDGARTDGRYRVMGEIPDDKGNIELLLHAYLYNLRLKARQAGSEIRFTIGNHDYHSVIKVEEPDWPYFYRRWVHENANNFFGGRKGRRDCLMPFYNCCPYLFLAVSDEIACIHGGLRGYDGPSAQLIDSTGPVIAIQNLIDAAGDFSGITAPYHAYLTNIQEQYGNGKEASPLWSRAYAAYPKATVCPLMGPEYKTVVVGHCQMAGGSCGQSGAHTSEILSTDPDYTRFGCGDLTGCVVAACDNNKSSWPTLAFVDIGFSRAFLPRGPTPPSDGDRRAEILYFGHNKSLEPLRHYNVIKRVNAGGGPDGISVWTAPPKPNQQNRRGNINTAFANLPRAKNAPLNSFYSLPRPPNAPLNQVAGSRRRRVKKSRRAKTRKSRN
jgi:hypothetical protein